MELATPPLTSIFNSWLNGSVEFFQFPFNSENSEQAKILWVVKLRWLALSMFMVFGGIGFAFGVPSKDHIGAYMGLVGLLLGFNVFTQIFFDGSAKKVNQIALCFQLGFDLCVLTGALYFTRGVENPFIYVFLLNASLGALLIPGYLSVPFLLLNHLFLGALQLEYLSSVRGAPNQPSFILSALVLQVLVFGFWLVMRSLGAYFETQNESQIQNRMLIEKQDRLRAIGALAAGFSHEFASPLNTAKIRIERLARSGVQPDATDALEAINTCELVLKNMNASQIDTRDLVLKQTLVHKLIEEVTQTWQHDHPNAQLKLDLKNIGLAELPPINFAQVILNLLDNAYEANPNSVILVTLSQRASRIYFSVHDRGPGFTSSVLEKLGEPFNTGKNNGTGLGLYVSQLFALSLGGELKIESDPHGSRVSIEWAIKEGARA